MRILVILPNWLGDAVMATPAIELLAHLYPNVRFTFLGSYVSIEALKHHPLCENAIIDETKKSSSRLIASYKLAKQLGKFDMAISFRNHIYSSLLLRFTGTVLTLAKKSWHSQMLLSHTPKISTKQHLVKQYVQLAMINNDDFNEEIPRLKLYINAKHSEKPLLGINAGATYGSAKRWYPEKFAAVAAAFHKEYDIVLFGGPKEVDISQEIAVKLLELGVKNFINLAGKTDIESLCANIASCALFITNDSGPMHVAAAYQVPTVSIFGPTKYEETSQWMNEKSVIVRHEMECSPCMKRECPLKHHECMKSITADEVIAAIKNLD
ncbi:MAG: lipopolysaccharide heptosyltransferase II [Campylobacterales bacterium]|nr:lipopolysaccharide heptosyltransferase II [Campylobacterales bacterium]